MVQPFTIEQRARGYVAAVAAHLLFERWLVDVAGAGTSPPPLPSDLRWYARLVRGAAGTAQEDVRVFPQAARSRSLLSGLLRRVGRDTPASERGTLLLMDKVDGPRTSALVAAIVPQIRDALAVATDTLLAQWGTLPAYGDSAGWGAALDSAAEQVAATASSQAEGDMLLAMKAVARLIVCDALHPDLRASFVNARGRAPLSASPQ